jgi:hypothetical protein
VKLRDIEVELGRDGLLTITAVRHDERGSKRHVRSVQLQRESAAALLRAMHIMEATHD